MASKRMSPVVRIVVAVAYAILALAATGRSVYQIGTKFAEAPVPYAISGASALLYGVIAFALWKRRMGLALVGTAIELTGVLVVGLFSVLDPEAFPRATVWSGFGAGYGFIPLVLPVLGLFWLFRRRKGE